MKNKTIPKSDQPSQTEQPPQSAEAKHEEISFLVNPPFRGTAFPANKKLSEDDWEKLEKTIPT